MIKYPFFKLIKNDRELRLSTVFIILFIKALFCQYRPAALHR